jgi:hypothetical protein
MNEMVEQMQNFNSGTGLAKVVFQIGRALRRQINNEKRTVFGSFKFESSIGLANQAFQFYVLQLRCYREAVDAWTIVGLRN